MKTRIILAAGGLLGCLATIAPAQTQQPQAAAAQSSVSEDLLNSIAPPPKVEGQGAAQVTSGDTLPTLDAAAGKPAQPVPAQQQVLVPAPAAAKASSVDSASVSTSVAPLVSKPPVDATEARFDESAFPEVVCRDNRGVYTPTNIPPGWRLVPLKQLRFEPAPSVRLANGAVYKIESSPYVLVPASDTATQPINPHALQVLYNFERAELDLLAQLTESLRPRDTTPISN